MSWSSTDYKDLGSLTVCDKDMIQTQQHINWIKQTLLAIIMQEIYTSGFKPRQRFLCNKETSARNPASIEDLIRHFYYI